MIARTIDLARQGGLALLLLLGLGACSWAPPVAEPPGNTPIANQQHESHSVAAGQISKQQSPVIATARRMLGVPYRYGGHSPQDGFDCSGLVFYAHQKNGIQIPRTAQAQFDFSSPVRREHLRPGDLLFFRTSGKRVSHVGFYLGPGRFLHAPGTGKQVSIADYRSTYWRSRFAGAGRVRH